MSERSCVEATQRFIRPPVIPDGWAGEISGAVVLDARAIVVQGHANIERFPRVGWRSEAAKEPAEDWDVDAPERTPEPLRFPGSMVIRSR